MSLPFKGGNKLKRQELFIKFKRQSEKERREARFARRREESKNPSLREERQRRNVPLTLERKRVWDQIDNDTSTGLGVSVDVERLQQQQTAEWEKAAQEDESPFADGEDDEEDRDSMIDSSSEDDQEPQDHDEVDTNGASSSKKRKTATERATSPTRSTTSTNLDLTPEALASKFPTLFSTGQPAPEPKVLVTTSLNSTLHEEAHLLTTLFPNSTYIPRSRHVYGHKFSIREISKFATNRGYTAIVVLMEDQKRPVGLDFVHLPIGPMFHFSISNWVEGKKLPGHGRPTNHYPELILNNFRTPLGLLTAHLFKTLFPPRPEFQGRQVVTLHNQRDFIFVRRHRYVFREKRETEKSVVGPDGKEVQGVEGIRAGLQELGPRFTLKLRRVDRGIQRASGQEWEWKGKTDKVRTKFQL